MRIDELVEKDKSFDKATFITKANNIIKKIYNSITLNELENIKHFMTEDLYKKFEKEIIDATNNNTRLFYDEVNVVSDIDRIEEIDSNYVIYVKTTSKYLKYYLSLSNGNLVSGDMNNRRTVSNTYIFKKKTNASVTSNHKCPGCGSNININDNGKCSYCGTSYNLEEHDYILTNIL